MESHHETDASKDQQELIYILKLLGSITPIELAEAKAKLEFVKMDENLITNIHDALPPRLKNLLLHLNSFDTAQRNKIREEKISSGVTAQDVSENFSRVLGDHPDISEIAVLNIHVFTLLLERFSIPSRSVPTEHSDAVGRILSWRDLVHSAHMQESEAGKIRQQELDQLIPLYEQKEKIEGPENELKRMRDRLVNDKANEEKIQTAIEAYKKYGQDHAGERSAIDNEIKKIKDKNTARLRELDTQRQKAIDDLTAQVEAKRVYSDKKPERSSSEPSNKTANFFGQLNKKHRHSTSSLTENTKQADEKKGAPSNKQLKR